MIKKGSAAEKAMQKLAIAQEQMRRHGMVDPEPRKVFYTDGVQDEGGVKLAAIFKDTIRVGEFTVPVPTVKVWHRLLAVASLKDLIAVGPMSPFASDDEKKKLAAYRKKVHSLTGLRWEPGSLREVAANIVYLLVYPAHRRAIIEQIEALEAQQVGFNLFARGRRAVEIAELKSKLRIVEETPSRIERAPVDQWQIDWMTEQGLAGHDMQIANEILPAIEKYLGLKKKEMVEV
jgi:hypothetical protein